MVKSEIRDVCSAVFQELVRIRDEAKNGDELIDKAAGCAVHDIGFGYRICFDGLIRY